MAAAALDAGAAVVNDVSGARDDEAMLSLVAARKCPVVLMHMQGTPRTMQLNPHYIDVTAEVAGHLRACLERAVAAGVAAERVILDPGIGFGKNEGHNLELLRRLRELTGANAGLGGRPILLGASRKGFIGRITGEPEPAQRLFGTAATVAWALAAGVSIVRVHDVRPMSQVARMIRAIQTDGRAVSIQN